MLLPTPKEKKYMRHKSPLRRPAILHATAQRSDKLQEKTQLLYPYKEDMWWEFLMTTFTL